MLAAAAARQDWVVLRDVVILLYCCCTHTKIRRIEVAPRRVEHKNTSHKCMF